MLVVIVPQCLLLQLVMQRHKLLLQLVMEKQHKLLQLVMNKQHKLLLQPLLRHLRLYKLLQPLLRHLLHLQQKLLLQPLLQLPQTCRRSLRHLIHLQQKLLQLLCHHREVTILTVLKFLLTVARAILIYTMEPGISPA
jgi:hypothetical protein